LRSPLIRLEKAFLLRTHVRTTTTCLQLITNISWFVHGEIARWEIRRK
jgi:hypothetical protein